MLRKVLDAKHANGKCFKMFPKKSRSDDAVIALVGEINRIIYRALLAEFFSQLHHQSIFDFGWAFRATFYDWRCWSQSAWLIRLYGKRLNKVKRNS